MQLSRFHYLLIAALGLLSVPLLATMLSDDFNWSVADFAVMAVLLVLLALGTELACRLSGTHLMRVVAVAGAVLLFLLIWAELAVGVFGTPLAGS